MGAYPARLGIMPKKVITHVDQVTPDWLTSVLINKRALITGAVAGFEVKTGQASWSTHALLNVQELFTERIIAKARYEFIVITGKLVVG